MISRRLCAILRRVNRDTLSTLEANKAAMLRLDLSDADYAEWFLSQKIVKGALNPTHAVNDFVIFRLAHDWPAGVVWTVNAENLKDADFTMTDEMASDLTTMAAEGLGDGGRSADWHLRVAATFYADRAIPMPPALFDFMQRALFLPEAAPRGRKRRDGVDRDRIIRNAFEGLLARKCGRQRAQEIIAHTLNMTLDAVRKVLDRTPRTDREERLWRVLRLRWAGVGAKPFGKPE